MPHRRRDNVSLSGIAVFWIMLLPMITAVYSGHGPAVKGLSAGVTPVAAPTTPGLPPGSVRCDYYDPVACSAQPHRCNHSVVTCSMFCYALWNTTGLEGGGEGGGEGVVVKKGCWLRGETCSSRACVERRETDKLKFCCCAGHRCNRRFAYRPVPAPPTTEMLPRRYTGARRDTLLSSLIYSLIPIMATAFIVPAVFWLWRSRKTAYRHAPVADADLLSGGAGGDGGDAAPAPLRSVQLIEIKARGRFGCVWRARMGDDGGGGGEQQVAVKVFPMHDRQSWAVERDFYSRSQVSLQPEILRFIAAEQRLDVSSAHSELWLITQYHEHGSLHDHLKATLLSWPQLLSIALSVSRGLAFLHEDGPLLASGGRKPAVAHRDIKSKNVLVKADLTACIADFGLAICFEAGKSVGDVHGQVGTRRYMAPEVLEGAINFTRDAFLRIDMYACGLLLWELASRCTAADGPVDEYRLPFEEEVSLHPSLEDMQETVVHKKMRPYLKDIWLKHAGLSTLCETIEECWDHDPEARLAAGCVMERVLQLISNCNAAADSTDAHQGAPPPPMVVALPPKESSI